jgi:hypothetical protein
MLYGRRTEDIVRSMSENLANVVGSLQQEMLALRNQVHSYQESHENTIRVVTEVCITLRTTLQTSVNRQESSTRNINVVLDKLTLLEKQQEKNHAEVIKLAQRGRPRHIIDTQQPTTMVAAKDSGSDGVAAAGADGADGAAGTIPPNKIVPATVAAAATNMARRLGMDALQVLLPNPRQPSLSAKFPETWLHLVEEWRRHDLDAFRKNRKSEWANNAMVMRYNKRLRGMEQLRKLMLTTRQTHSDEEMATRLDVERHMRRLTLSKHIDVLHENDRTILRRRRRNNIDEEANDDDDDNDNNNNDNRQRQRLG